MQDYLVLGSANAFPVWLEVVVFLAVRAEERLELLRQTRGYRLFLRLRLLW